MEQMLRHLVRRPLSIFLSSVLRLPSSDRGTSPIKDRDGRNPITEFTVVLPAASLAHNLPTARREWPSQNCCRCRSRAVTACR